MRKRNIKTKTRVLLTLALIILVAPIFMVAIPVKEASAACAITWKWTRSLKPVKDVKVIHTDDIDQYILSLNVNDCAGNSLMGTYNRTNDIQGRDIFPEQQLSGGLVKSIKFDTIVSNATLDTYKFQFAIVNSGNQILVRAKDVVVEFKPGSSPVGINPNDPTSANTNANANTNTGNPNENINTDVSVQFSKEGLDEKIGDFWNPLNSNTLPELLATVLRILFALIGMVAVIIIIISGFRMVLASGNETELTKAKAAITWAIVGLIVSLMSFSIVAIIQRLIQTNVVK